MILLNVLAQRGSEKTEMKLLTFGWGGGGICFQPHIHLYVQELKSPFLAIVICKETSTVSTHQQREPSTGLDTNILRQLPKKPEQVLLKEELHCDPSGGTNIPPPSQIVLSWKFWLTKLLICSGDILLRAQIDTVFVTQPINLSKSRLQCKRY